MNLLIRTVSLIAVFSFLLVSGCGDRSQKSKTKLTAVQALEHYLKIESGLKSTGWRFYATQKKASGLYAYLDYPKESLTAPVESELQRLCPDKNLDSFWQDTRLESFYLILIKNVRANDGKATRLAQITCKFDFDRVAFEKSTLEEPISEPILDVELDRKAWYDQIMDALSNDDPMAVRRLANERQQYIDTRNDRGESLLHFCKSGETASILLENGAKVDAKTTWGATPLIYAADFSKTDFASVLISAGADVNHMDSQSYTPLKFSQNVAMAKFLVENGARVPNDALIQPAGSGRLDLMKYLHSKGAQVNGKNALGETALHKTAQSSPKKSASTIAEWLLQHGADVNALSKFKKTPYDIAMQRQTPNHEMLTMLSKYGGKPAEQLTE